MLDMMVLQSRVKSGNIMNGPAKQAKLHQDRQLISYGIAKSCPGSLTCVLLEIEERSGLGSFFVRGGFVLVVNDYELALVAYSRREFLRIYWRTTSTLASGTSSFIRR